MCVYLNVFKSIDTSSLKEKTKQKNLEASSALDFIVFFLLLDLHVSMFRLKSYLVCLYVRVFIHQSIFPCVCVLRQRAKQKKKLKNNNNNHDNHHLRKTYIKVIGGLYTRQQECQYTRDEKKTNQIKQQKKNLYVCILKIFFFVLRGKIF